MMPATSVEASMIAAMEVGGVMPADITAVMHALVTMSMMVRTTKAFWQIETRFVNWRLIVLTHRPNGPPIGTETDPSKPQYSEQNTKENDGDSIHLI